MPKESGLSLRPNFQNFRQASKICPLGPIEARAFYASPPRFVAASYRGVQQLIEHRLTLKARVALLSDDACFDCSLLSVSPQTMTDRCFHECRIAFSKRFFLFFTIFERTVDFVSGAPTCARHANRFAATSYARCHATSSPPVASMSLQPYLP